MIHKARVLLPFLRLAVEPIADLADAPIIAGHRLLNELLCGSRNGATNA